MKYRKSNWKAVTNKVSSLWKPHKNYELLGCLYKSTAPHVLLSHQTALEQQKDLCWYAAYADLDQARKRFAIPPESLSWLRVHTHATNWAFTNVSHNSVRNLQEFLQCTTSCCKSGVFAHAIVMGHRLVIFGQHLLSIQGVAICCCWLQARAIDSVVCCNTGAVQLAGPAPFSRHAHTEKKNTWASGYQVVCRQLLLTAPRGYEYKHNYMKWYM